MPLPESILQDIKQWYTANKILSTEHLYLKSFFKKNNAINYLLDSVCGFHGITLLNINVFSGMKFENDFSNRSKIKKVCKSTFPVQNIGEGSWNKPFKVMIVVYMKSSSNIL